MSDIPRLYRLAPKRAFMLFVFLDVICAGIGMGVPFMNILFGCVVGCYLERWLSITMQDGKELLHTLVVYAGLTASVTFAIMLIIWGPSISYLFDSDADLATYGIPLILYEPRASFIGWLVLMIVISPVLQLLTTVFSGNLSLLFHWRKGRA